jgi:hypothetical protein
LAKGKPPRKEVACMKGKEKSQLIKWLALSLLLGAAARFLEALTEFLRLFM